MIPLKQTAREIFLRTLSECTVERAFAANVAFSDGLLNIAGQQYRLERYSRVLTIALGKAAHSMADALHHLIGDRASGIVIAPHAPARPLPGFRYFAGGHPLPNSESLLAGAAVLETLQAAGGSALVIYLISGGGSALLESPIDPRFTLEDVVAAYRALLHSGANIAEMNAVRKHLSAIKGGRMAQAAAPAEQVSLLISDVPDGALDALASGPTLPDSSTCEDCYQIAQRCGLLSRLPPRVHSLFQERQLQETPKSGDPAFATSRWHALLSSQEAQTIAAAHAAAAGFTVLIDNACDDWDYADAADYLLQRLAQAQKLSGRVCLISGGEVTVNIPREPGLGGRNQQFALYCAQRIAGKKIIVLSAGTDGIDGNSAAAGAVVDGETFSRAGAERIQNALAAFDSNPLLRELGDTLETGPTGNNLRDLRMLFAE